MLCLLSRVDSYQPWSCDWLGSAICPCFEASQWHRPILVCLLIEMKWGSTLLTVRDASPPHLAITPRLLPQAIPIDNSNRTRGAEPSAWPASRPSVQNPSPPRGLTRAPLVTSSDSRQLPAEQCDTIPNRCRLIHSMAAPAPAAEFGVIGCLSQSP